MYEHTQEFYIPAGAVGVGAVAYMKPAGDKATKLKLTVTRGGPVFLFKGRLTAEEAYRRSHEAGAISFDLSSSGGEDSELGVSERYGMFTLHSDNESVGFVRDWREDK